MDWKIYLFVFFIIAILFRTFWYLNYWLFLYQKKVIQTDTTKAFQATVIISAKNELENLKTLIPQIITQKGFSELIIALDHCTDNSHEFISKLYPNIKLIEINNTPVNYTSKKWALQNAIAVAQNPILVFTDADCTIKSDNWLSLMAIPCIENAACIGYSPYISNKSILSNLINFETSLTFFNFASWAEKENAFMGVGRNMAYQKKHFEKVNGFEKHQSIIGGDDDLTIQKLKKIDTVFVQYDPNAHVFSYPKDSFKELFFQKRRHLKTGMYYNRLSLLMLVLFGLSEGTIWLITPILLLKFPFICSIILISYLLFFWTIFRLIAKKYNTNKIINLFLFCFLDILFNLFNLVVSVSLLLNKKIRWN